MSRTLRLNSGFTMPLFGLGTLGLPQADIQQFLSVAVDIGYRHFDCAWVYQNEEAVGNALSSILKTGKVRRENLFITTKLWSSFHRPEMVAVGFNESLSKLKLDYVDLYLIHWPVSFKPGNVIPEKSIAEKELDDVDLLETWKQLESLVDSGKVRSIGLSNFNIPQVEEIIENCRIKPAVLQIEIHAYFPNKELVEFCRRHVIQVVGYSPLGNPGLFDQNKSLLQNHKVLEIAKQMNATSAQVLISYVLHRNIACIPKTSSVQRLRENFNAQKITLTDEDFDVLDNLNINRRFLSPDIMKMHKNFPFETVHEQ